MGNNMTKFSANGQQPRVFANGKKELNFSIYGCCLAIATQKPELQATGKQKRKSDSNVCFRWNNGISCNKSTCRFSHRHWCCAGAH